MDHVKSVDDAPSSEEPPVKDPAEDGEVHTEEMTSVQMEDTEHVHKLFLAACR